MTPTDLTGRRTAKYCQSILCRPGLLDLVGEDGVGLAQAITSLPSDLAQDAHGQTGSGEGLTVHDLAWQAQIPTDGPHLVLEELTQRLHELHLQVLGQAPHIVVALDHRGGSTMGGHRLDHIGIERTPAPGNARW